MDKKNEAKVINYQTQIAKNSIMKINYTISEDRILQITNDIAEDMCTATAEELIQVVNYWRDQLEEWIRDCVSMRTEIMTDLMLLVTKYEKESKEERDKYRMITDEDTK